MRKIILGFSRPIKPTLFSRAIMWSDNTNYSHVYVKWEWTRIERYVIYQASKLAVNFESNITFDTHAITVKEYEIELCDDTEKEIMQWCMDNSNKPYSWLSILGFVYSKACEKFLKLKVHNPFPTHGSSFVCSKVAANILAISKKVEISSSFDDIDPEDVDKMLAKAAGLGLARLIYSA